jgi:myo-inositol-1(or 4)-monophosphatase
MQQQVSIEHAMSIATDAARAAGQILRDMLLTASVREKGPKDLVTDADIAAQRAIEQRIFEAFPDHLFIGEENDAAFVRPPKSDGVLRWVVDPLDGTANFVHRFPNFAVSIGLTLGDTILLGVVYDPMANELYTAIQGQGAMMNGQPICVSHIAKLDQAMVAASFPPQVNRESVEIEQFVEMLIQCQSLRRLGSAALNLCYVAHGRLDAYWANALKPWDMAAGVLIAQEAGALVRRIDGQPFDVWDGELLAAASRPLMSEIQSCFAVASAARRHT